MSETSNTEDANNANMLRRALHRINCPDGEELFMYHTNQLAFGRRREIDAHLKICGSCRQELSLFESPVFGWPEMTNSPGLLEQLVTYVAEKLKIAPELRPALRGDRILIGTFRIEARGWDIMLEQVSLDAGFAIYGSVMSAEPIGPAIVAAFTPTENALLAEAEIDDTGWFKLSGLDEGEYDLRIEAQNFRVEIPRIEIKLTRS